MSDMKKLTGILTEFGDSWGDRIKGRTYSYLMVDDLPIKNVVVLDELDTKLRSSLGEKISLFIVFNRLVAITTGEGRTYARTHPGAYAVATACLISFLTLFLMTWALGAFYNPIALFTGLLDIIAFLLWSATRLTGQIDRVIRRELPKNAIPLN